MHIAFLLTMLAPATAFSLKLLTARCEMRRHSLNVKHLVPKSVTLRLGIRHVREIARRKDQVIKDRQGIVEYSALPCLLWICNLPNATARKYTIRLQQAIMISRIRSPDRILVVSAALLHVKQHVHIHITSCLISYYEYYTLFC